MFSTVFWGDILIDLGLCVKQRMKFWILEDWSLGLMCLMVREKRMVEGDSMMALYLRLRDVESACKLCSSGVSQL